MNMYQVVGYVLAGFYLLQGLRLLFVYYSNRVNANETDRVMALKSKSVMVVFGSGGHTTEMLKLL